MFNVRISTLLILLAVCNSVPPAIAGKITVDPNVPGAQGPRPSRRKTHASLRKSPTKPNARPSPPSSPIFPP